MPAICGTADLARQVAEFGRRLAAVEGRVVSANSTGADRIQTETMADTLMHLFLHSQHHRGQAHAMLSGTSVPPPQLDEFFMADDAAARAEDVAALGWTEANLA